MEQEPAPPPASPAPPASAVPQDPIDAEIEAAARLAGLEFDEEERAQMERSVRRARRRYERRREQGFPPNGLQPATTFDPLAAHPWGYHGNLWPEATKPSVDMEGAGPLPEDDAAIACAPAWKQAAWLRGGGLTSVRLTEIALERIARLDPQLKACVTVTAERAREEAQRADEMFAKGYDRGPVHGLPWGAKDLFDTKGIATTWGAAPYRDRVPEKDAMAVELMGTGGAVLVAKTSLGALAMGDVWFGGRTRNPWNLEQGSSGSSAGSAAGVVAGLYSFALGTETLGSIVSPSVRCGATGLRPSFGRVDRSGAMALCWSLDKIGPIARSVRDARMVMHALVRRGKQGDASMQETPLRARPKGLEGAKVLAGVRVGVRSEWLEGERVPASVSATLDKLIALGAEAVEVELPEGPHEVLRTILEVEAAAAFEELTLSGRDGELTRQDRGAWPNTFRSAWMVPAVEFLQADRYRRQLAVDFEEALVRSQVDVLLSHPFQGDLLLVTNFTGHPCLTLPVARGDGSASVTLWGRLMHEPELCRIGEALEDALALPDPRPLD